MSESTVKNDVPVTEGSIGGVGDIIGSELLSVIKFITPTVNWLDDVTKDELLSDATTENILDDNDDVVAMVAISSGNDSDALDDEAIDSMLVIEASGVIEVGVINASKPLSVMKSVILLIDDDIAKD